MATHSCPAHPCPICYPPRCVCGYIHTTYEHSDPDCRQMDRDFREAEKEMRHKMMMDTLGAEILRLSRIVDRIAVLLEAMLKANAPGGKP